MGFEFLTHEIHIAGNMGKELPVALAQIIDSMAEAVLGTLPMTSKQPLTLTALPGQQSRLHLSEL